MKVSIIIPVLNDERINKTIYSLFRQDYSDFEIIIVDDGSTDNFINNSLLKYNNNPTIKIYYSKHKGPASARNYGCKQATGEIIIFIDSDCDPSIDWLVNMIKPFEDVTVSGVQGRYLTKQRKLLPLFIQCEMEERYRRMSAQNTIDFVSTYSAAYKKEILFENNSFDETFKSASGEDTDLSYSIHKKGYKLIFQPKAIVFHEHPETIVKYLSQKYLRGYWSIYLYSKHPYKAISNSYTPQHIKIECIITIIYMLSFLFSSQNYVILLSLYLFLLVINNFMILKIYYKYVRYKLVLGIIYALIRNLGMTCGLIFGSLHYGLYLIKKVLRITRKTNS